MKKLRNWFISGIITIFPIALTFYLIGKVVEVADNMFVPVLKPLTNLSIPGIGFILAVIVIILVGALTSNILGKKVASWVELLFSKIPIIKTIFVPLKQIVSNMSSNTNNAFRQVVLVEFPRDNSYSIGFITSDSVEMPKGDMIPIFVPTTPNPTNGFLIYVKSSEYTPLNIGVDEGIKMVISMGTISPDRVDEIINKVTL